MDSAKYHREAWIKVIKDYGPIKDEAEISRIYDSDDMIAGMAGIEKVEKLTVDLHLIYDDIDYNTKKELLDKKEEIVDKLIYDNAKEIPGALSFLEELKDYGAVLALATSYRKKPALKKLKQLNMDIYFKAMVFREDLKKQSKPNPEYYHKAAKLIKAKSNRTVVFEDSIPGFEGVIESKYNLVSIGMKPEYLEKYKPLMDIKDYTKISIQKLEKKLLKIK